MPLAATSSVKRATVSLTDRPLIFVTVSRSSLVRVSGIAHLRMFDSAKHDHDGQRNPQHDHDCGESNHDAPIHLYVLPTPYGLANSGLPYRDIPDEADAEQCSGDTKDGIRPFGTAGAGRHHRSHG